MTDPIPFRRPINWTRLRTDEAERVIRERALDRDNIVFGNHAFDRIEDRSIVQRDVYRILEEGKVTEPPEWDPEHEEWKIIVWRRMPGNRDAGAVTLIMKNEDEIFVKTVMWKDWPR